VFNLRHAKDSCPSLLFFIFVLFLQRYKVYTHPYIAIVRAGGRYVERGHGYGLLRAHASST